MGEKDWEWRGTLKSLIIIVEMEILFISLPKSSNNVGKGWQNIIINQNISFYCLGILHYTQMR